MKKCWKIMRVGALIATLSLTTALPVFANSDQNEGDSIQTSRRSFEDLIVSSLAATGLAPALIIAAVQKVREALL